ncbi:TPA: N-glycosylase/DNA lyase [Candidatus Woesearchaeota archaeon]|nr:putative N-glycosylase/DNA lyase [archaeon GW2011_AR15]MBS3103475.1 N-glycosylase/DNA lyase [Candidatus Woesearchaeota archaeon]HIH41593.1 N-glycosylase/DNA lyase [Candidatus Woesearchaeota archaeon]
MDREQLLAVYNVRRDRIKSRLGEFTRFYNEPVSWFYEEKSMVLKPVDRDHNERIFEELCFCLMTANTSAEMGLKGVDGIRKILFTGSLEDIQLALADAGYRYPNKRAEYIIEARERFSDVRELVESHEDKKKLREHLAENVKGLGYKEASHFLRNIGVFGLAILDKHILRTMHEHGVIEGLPKSLNRKNYLDIEEKFIKFADELEINMDELDLLLWSMKNGRILK